MENHWSIGPPTKQMTYYVIIYSIIRWFFFYLVAHTSSAHLKECHLKHGRERRENLDIITFVEEKILLNVAERLEFFNSWKVMREEEKILITSNLSFYRKSFFFFSKAFLFKVVKTQVGFFKKEGRRGQHHYFQIIYKL